MANKLCMILAAICRLDLELSLVFLSKWAALAAVITHRLHPCRFRDNRSS